MKPLVTGTKNKRFFRRQNNCPHNKNSLRAFSLIELFVVIVLVGGLMMVVIPTVNSLSGAQLKKEITKIAGLVSEVYSKASLVGKTHRVVLNLDNQTFWVEEQQGEGLENLPALGYDQKELAKLKKDLENSEQGLSFLPQFKALGGPLGEKRKLDKDLVFHGAWTDQMEDISRNGEVYIYFFQGGFSQLAMISIAKRGQEESAIHLVTQPLTGLVNIDLGEPEIKNLQEDVKDS